VGARGARGPGLPLGPSGKVGQQAAQVGQQAAQVGPAPTRTAAAQARGPPRARAMIPSTTSVLASAYS
jgi:hypothetical protein